MVVMHWILQLDFTITYQKRRRYEFLKSHFCFYEPFPLTLYLADSELKLIGLFFRAAYHPFSNLFFTYSDRV